MKARHENYSSETKESLIKEFMDSDMSEQKFALSKGINFYTFRSWFSNTNKEKNNKPKMIDITKSISDIVTSSSKKEFILFRIKGIEIEIIKDNLKDFIEVLLHD